jgi:hypothetical protein
MKREEEESEPLHRVRRCSNCIAAAAITEDAQTLPKFLRTSQEFSGDHTFRVEPPRPTPWFGPRSSWDARASCLPLKAALAMSKSETSFAIFVAWVQKHPYAQHIDSQSAPVNLRLAFVPDAEQRLWRTIMRTKYQLMCNRVQLQNWLEALLETHIKLSSLVSDLWASAPRTLEDGETNPETVASPADRAYARRRSSCRTRLACARS